MITRITRNVKIAMNFQKKSLRNILRDMSGQIYEELSSSDSYCVWLLGFMFGVLRGKTPQALLVKQNRQDFTSLLTEKRIPKPDREIQGKPRVLLPLGEFCRTSNTVLTKVDVWSV